jgi:methylmalonyl-CoA/ethylmalonyl-CoA epimerase
MDPIALSWVPQGSFHHVGFVVASIDAAIQSIAKSVDAEWDGVITHDPLQSVKVAFVRPRRAADPLLELVEPAGEKSPVLAFLKRGGGLHHLCYEVDQLDQQLERSRANGGLVVRAPVPAVAFGGRRIAWFYTKEKLLIEYLER